MSSSNNITNNKSYHQTAGQQEMERFDRMNNEHFRRGNAKFVSEMISSYSSPSTKCSSKGSILHLKYVSEQERKRQLENPEQLRASKALAMEVASLFQKSNYMTLNSYYQGSKRSTKKMEEQERQRRMMDLNECRARKVNALEVSDAIRVDASTIKARFIHRGPSMKSLKKNIIHAADNVMPGGVKQALSSFFQRAYNIKDSIVHSVQNAMKGESVSLQAIKLMEEAERQRRTAEDNAGSAIGNAKRVSQLLHIAKFPKLSHHKGYSLYTSAIEEEERTRRLANKFECESKRMMAGEVSRLISQLEWPFISSAKNVNSCAPSAMLSEGERARRMDDKQEMIAARMHANKIAKLVSAAVSPRNKSFAHSYIRALEEKERAYRVNTGAEYAVHNAHREAQQIADIGGMFYLPTQQHIAGRKVPLQKLTKSGKEEERKRGMEQSREQIEGQKKARKIAKMVQNKQAANQLAGTKLLKSITLQAEPIDLSFDTKLLEEMERKYRLANKDLEHQAKVSANNVARLIKKQNPYTPNKFAAPQQLKKSGGVAAPQQLQKSGGVAAPQQLKKSGSVAAPQQLKKSGGIAEFSLWAKKLDLPQPSNASATLIETVQRLYDMEVQLSERAEKKTQLESKGAFGTYRSNSFAAAAKKHNDNAKLHLQWLHEARRSTVSAPTAVAQAKVVEPVQPISTKAATAAH